MTKLFEFKSISLFEINLIINMLDMEVRQPWSVGFQKKLSYQIIVKKPQTSSLFIWFN